MRQVLYLTDAKRLAVSQENIAVTAKDEQQYLLHPKDLLAIVIDTLYCHVTLPALLFCNAHHIPLLICNKKHQPELYCIDYYQHSLLLSRLNTQINWSAERKQQAWKQIITQKISQQLAHLRFMQSAEPVLVQIEAYLQALPTYQEKEQIDTTESIVARLYFSALFGDHFKRFSGDSVNQALNYGYALLRSLIITALTAKGWHPTLGIWHHSVRNRYNFADDIIESFRPLADHHVRQLITDQDKTLTVEHRRALLKVLQHKMYWHEKQQHLRYCIYSYLDAITDFLNEKRENIPAINWTYCHETDTFCTDADV